MAAYRGQSHWVLARLESEKGNLQAIDSDGWTALHWCCAGRNEELGKELDRHLVTIAQKLLEADRAC